MVAGPAIHERVYLLRYVAERDSPGAPQRRVGEVPQEGAEGLVDVGLMATEPAGWKLGSWCCRQWSHRGDVWKWKGLKGLMACSRTAHGSG